MIKLVQVSRVPNGLRLNWWMLVVCLVYEPPHDEDSGHFRPGKSLICVSCPIE